MKTKFYISLFTVFFIAFSILIAATKTEPIAYTDSVFAGSIILGRPNMISITANITSEKQSQIYIAWGDVSNIYSQNSKTEESSNLKPAVIVINELLPDKVYYYRLFFKDANTPTVKNTSEYSFRTPRAIGEEYTFVVQSDSHLLNKADKELYAKSMQTMASFKPDFLFDLGDTFLNDQVANPQSQNYETIRKISFEQRSFFDIVTRNASLFLTVGNHEGEYGYFLDGTNKNLAAMSTLARKTYYPNPIADGFYSGNTQTDSVTGQPQNYYAFVWGDALYVSIDPYRYSLSDPYNDKDGWNWTLGKEQYDWFKKTLQESTAKYKFVFAHHAIGNIRGGAEIAKLYEWGGYEKNGQYVFDQKRPGWGKPIQQIMKDTGVTIFFQGHDHLFAVENVDGVVYQTLPKPAEKIADIQSNFNAYPDCDKLMNSGFLKVVVSAENVQVDFYRNYFVSTESQQGNTGIVYSYTVDTEKNIKVLKSTTDDLSKYGNGTAQSTPTKKIDKTDKTVKETTPKASNTNPGSARVENTKTVSAIQSSEKTTGGVILGAITDTSVTVKAIASGAIEAYFEYGVSADRLRGKTTSKAYKNGEVIDVVLGNLLPDTQYYYSLLSRSTGSTVYNPVQSGTFHTQRSVGEPFVFTIQSDSHRDENTDITLYETALENILNDHPDFHIDLGDTFMAEKFAKTKETTIQRYLEDRAFFATLAGSVPLFLVNGNHEGENGWNKLKSTDNVAMWASVARLTYFPNPKPQSFYSGSVPGQGNYYSFIWGDALFIMLDPFWFSDRKAQGNDDGWSYTLGKTQYDWLKNTLEKSSAKFTFVFLHNLVGGYSKDARGGAEAAKFFEWGGNNSDGSAGFQKMRPGWGQPIHQLLVENNVTAVFHGHDHFYAKQQLDGIIYQLVPQPGHPGIDVRNAAEYSYEEGTFLPPAGHLRVSVSADSVTIEYVIASLQENKNGNVANSYLIE